MYPTSDTVYANINGQSLNKLNCFPYDKVKAMLELSIVPHLCSGGPMSVQQLGHNVQRHQGHKSFYLKDPSCYQGFQHSFLLKMQ